MRLLSSNADIYIPGRSGPATVDVLEEVIRNVTHVSAGMHPDDTEVGFGPAVGLCHNSAAFRMLVITITDGRNPPKSGPFAEYTPAKMGDARTAEQRRAADIAKYAAVVQLRHTSEGVCGAQREAVVSDLATLIGATNCQELWAHHPLDRHESHVSAAMRTIEALRRLEPDKMPKRFFGGEVWGCIDPLPCSCIEEFDVSPYADLLDEVLGAFESQNFCKDYTAGVRGRHEANATFRKSHEGNYGKRIALAVKLHEFLTNAGLRVRDWASDVYALSARQGLDRIDKAA